MESILKRVQTPEGGVHPRLLITKEELPEVRRRIGSTAIGKKTVSFTHRWLGCFHNPDGHMRRLYEILLRGDRAELEKYAPRDVWWDNMLVFALAVSGLDCLIREDDLRGRELAQAYHSLNLILSGEVKNINLIKLSAEGCENYMFAFAYDFIQPYMDDIQTELARSVLAGIVARKIIWEGDNPYEEAASYNWIPTSSGGDLINMALEGEDGYRPSLHKNAVQTVRNYFKYGVMDDGFPTEDQHYYNFGMHYGSNTIMAWIRRGIDVLSGTNYKKALPWYFYSLEPFGYASIMMGDTPNDAGGPPGNYVLLKNLYPDCPLTDYIWRNNLWDDYSGINRNFIMLLLYGLDWEGCPEDVGGTDEITQYGAARSPEEKRKAMSAGLNAEKTSIPLSLFGPKRGLYFMRSDYTSDAAQLTMNLNAYVGIRGHMHCDTTGFIFTALGQRWAFDRGFHICETKHHSNILIDGGGQLFRGWAGREIAAHDHGMWAFVTGCAKNTYEYRIEGGGRPNHAERDFDPETWELLHPPLNIWKKKEPENNLIKAFRTAILVRGAHPYALIVDDIQKDGEVRLYEWLMQIRDELELKETRGTDLIIGLKEEKESSPRLVVRSIEGFGTPAAESRTCEEYHIFRDQALTGSNAYKGEGKKLVIATRAVSPNFKTLLLPCRAGEPAPETSFDGKTLTVAWPGQRDVFTFDAHADGYMSITRNE